MSAMLQQPTAPGPTATGRRGSLFRAEVHRFTARRFIQVLVGLAVLGWLGAVAIGLSTFREPTDADVSAARAAMEQAIADEQMWREECLTEAERAGDNPEVFCGPPLDASQWRVEDFIGVEPFDLASAAGAGAMAFAAGAAVLAFLIGATWIGAEWSSRSIVALLFWVPSRLKVMGTKIGVLVAATALLGVVAQAAWLAMGFILRSFVGTSTPLPDDFWTELLPAQGRSVLLTVLAGVIGFGLANLIRNTGAALGVGFVYFAIVENALRIYDITLERWLLSTNAVALVFPGGIRLYDYEAMTANMSEPPYYLVTNLQGGLVVGAFAVVIVGVGVLLFARRDIH
ncbi:hypothetical protein GCU60_11115 [Blastococcus saxobsidens]|uniref:ABC transporter permease n=1 Tax=Blastococcus saxobsidens TaxID=138336 RepID=A0A6L9W4F1_9ACTN|nr:hypothetical protein [Blastococcus saxobsidens]NEK86304.1 hypothetical protein [Blastococcus saxobsidens]